MKDYTKELSFWKRLESFVSDVQTDCALGEEEKQMIMRCCKSKIVNYNANVKCMVSWLPLIKAT